MYISYWLLKYIYWSTFFFLITPSETCGKLNFQRFFLFLISCFQIPAGWQSIVLKISLWTSDGKDLYLYYEKSSKGIQRTCSPFINLVSGYEVKENHYHVNFYFRCLDLWEMKGGQARLIFLDIFKNKQHSAYFS